jgi:hypothetical protein
MSSGLVPELHGAADAAEAYEAFFRPLERSAGQQAPNAQGAEGASGGRPWWRRGRSGIQRSPLLYRSYQTIQLQLKRAEESTKHPDEDGFLTLEPAGSTSRSYVLTCRRGLVTTRMYTLIFEVSYAVLDEPAGRCSSPAVPAAAEGSSSPAVAEQPAPAERQSRRRVLIDEYSHTIVVSPNPVAVSLFALGGGALGALLRDSACRSGLPGGLRDDLCRNVGTLWPSGILTAVVLAVTFFNVFEFTTLGERFTKATSWRGALLIGLLSGLGSAKFLIALRTVVG